MSTGSHTPKRSLFWGVSLMAILSLPVVGEAFPDDGSGGFEVPAIFADWLISGTVAARTENYNVKGDKASSSYQFLGNQGYGELDLSAVNEVSPYETISVDLHGLVNFSDYRSQFRSGTLERAKVTWEKGDAGVPFRLEGGDIYSYFSGRTLQRSLKGGQVEIQPAGPMPGVEHSLILAAGAQNSVYRDFGDPRPYHAGASYVVSISEAADFGFHFAHHDSNLNGPGFRQNVASVTAGKTLNALGQQVALEGELAYLKGGLTDTTEGEDFSGYAQVTGKSETLPFDYRFRFEMAGGEFTLIGGSVAANREAEEAHVGWRFADGLYLTARHQRFVDQRFFLNERYTHTNGVNLAGPLFQDYVPGLTGNIATTLQSVEDDDRTVDTDTLTTQASFNMPLDAETTGTLSLFWQHGEDNLTDDKTKTSQGEIAVSRGFRFQDWEMSVRPGVSMRHTRTATSTDTDLGVSLALSARTGDHSLSLNGRYADQQRKGTVTSQIYNTFATAQYGYQYDRHRFGVEGEYVRRNPAGGLHTTSYKTALFYEFSFDKPARRKPETTEEDRPTNAALMLMAPGTSLTGAQAQYASAGFGAGLVRGNTTVFERQILPRAGGRQRVVYETSGGRVTRSGVLIDLPEIGAEQAFVAVLEELLDVYGNPDLTFEEGVIGAGLGDAVATGRLIRIYEWKVPGGTVRLGLPARGDRVVRAEVVFARTFPPQQTRRWGFNNVF